ncbi:28S ribosomal protein S2, mitochondrial-like [Oppia nitens]|uniref:28S ribosomal protein S2, mitochondrial-like n=1 Tax=Oppia nitens TaxID=1686743 RepID=UPI0023D9E245|nr:28S ribosomal protein S2, mitochondrial-like [Oppia nitens]
MLFKAISSPINRLIKTNVLNTCLRQVQTSVATRQQQQPSLDSFGTESADDKTVVMDETIKKAYEESLSHADYFDINRLFTVRQLFESRVHLGHKLGTLNPHMTPYLFGKRLGSLVIDLDQTAQRLREALNFTAHIAFRDGIILFINRSLNTTHLVEKTAKECNQFSHCREWNSRTFYDSTIYFGAVTRLPDLVIFLNAMNNVFEMHPAVVDSAKLLIPTVGIVDTNSDPTLITYPIPGNDDTYQSIQLFCRLFKQSIILGQRKRKQLLDSLDNR